MNTHSFNPNATALENAGIYGLPFSADEATLILIPVPWEVTVSYGEGASQGPEIIRQASMQVDLYHHDYPGFWQKGIFMDEIPEKITALNKQAKKKAQQIIEALEEGEEIDGSAKLTDALDEVNAAGAELNAWVQERVSHWKKQNKKVGLIGGDHSSPFGYMQWVSANHTNVGILHIDAHMDLRHAYEDFVFSHASIFYNVHKTLPGFSKLVQVGIRDYCDEERDLAFQHPDKIKVFYDREMAKRAFSGENWDSVCSDIIAQLPHDVYISVDIDGLDPKLCPGTGTPVPGGLDYEPFIHLLNRLKQSNRNIVGFDLCEVSPGGDKSDEWNGNVGARVLYHLCGLML